MVQATPTAQQRGPAGRRVVERLIAGQIRASAGSDDALTPPTGSELESNALRNLGEVANQSDYRRAVEMLAHGQVQAGSHALGEIARRTHDDQLRSTCLHSLGEVLHQLKLPNEAYRVWYRLAHKPRDLRNGSDVSARCRVVQMFDQAGLRLIPPDFPPKIQVEITNRCNLKCVMCTRNQMTRPVADLPVEYLKRIADECCVEPGSGLMLFFLGEPLLHPRLEEMVAYLNAVKDSSPVRMGFALQTNGMLLTRQRARALIEAGLRVVYISVDGLEGDLERIRPGARYPIVERNILDLVALRQELGCTDMHVCISKLCDDPKAEEVQRFCQRWKGRVDGIYLNGITKVAGNSYMGADGELHRVGPDECAPRRAYCSQGQRLLVLSNGDYGFCHGGRQRRVQARQRHGAVNPRRVELARDQPHPPEGAGRRL